MAKDADEPRFDDVDHIHVHVADRDAARGWYERVLRLSLKRRFERWAVPKGPLMLEDESGSVRLALFNGKKGENQSIVALRVSGAQMLAWKKHLDAEMESPPRLEDHGMAWSMYFSDPDGNPFEITTYDVEGIEGALRGE